MNKRTENRHMVDVLFVIALFCMFAISALMLVIIGADVYRKTVSDMDTNFTARTSFSYVTEKIRQNDLNGNVSIGSFGDSDAIIITEEVNDESFTHYLYLYEGNLCELFCRTGALGPEAGDDIIAMDSFTIEQVNEHLYEVELLTADGDATSLMVSTHSN